MTSTVFNIRPGAGIGPVDIGMSRQEAKRAMEATGHSVDSFVRWGDTPVLAMLQNSSQVYFDRSGRVEAVEVMGPARDGQIEGVEPPFAALYREVDVFRTPASKLAEVVCRDAEPDSAARDYGVAFDFPSIGLSLWREASKDTPFFETVAVSRSNRS